MWATAVTKQVEKKAKTTLPLEKHVANMRQYFVNQRLEIPALQQTVVELEKKYQEMDKRYQIRARKDIRDEINEINEEILIRKNMVREHEYEQMIAPYITAYNQRVEIDEVHKEVPRNITVPGCGKKRETIDTYVQQYDATASRQTTLINEYLMETSDEPPKLALNTRDECPLCHNSLTLVNTKAIMTCSSCGYSIAYLDATMQSMSYSDDVEFSSFSYKRINHFNEWLQQVQAKENFEISQDILNSVMEELYRQRVTDVADITPKRCEKS